jgi:hypothetical protein
MAMRKLAMSRHSLIGGVPSQPIAMCDREEHFPYEGEERRGEERRGEERRGEERRGEERRGEERKKKKEERRKKKEDNIRRTSSSTGHDMLEKNSLRMVRRDLSSF